MLLTSIPLAPARFVYTQAKIKIPQPLPKKKKNPSGGFTSGISEFLGSHVC